MRSLIGGIITAVKNKTPVSYASSATTFPLARNNGVEVQLRAMSNVGTLHAIVHRTSNATSQVKWHLWRKAASGKDEDRVEVTKHAALDLWNKPNKYMTRQELVEVTQQHIDLAGEGWWVVGRNPMAKIPLELWPVRPDRMAPIPHSTDFLSGYEYTGPDGKRIPLDVNDVIFTRVPDPMDPYRGLSPIQSIMSDLDATRYSSEWNRNFFLNSAEPGGVIEYDRRLSDDEFDEITMRWSGQHQGVANAHRVAVIEQGKWIDRKYTQRDMQFVELRNVSRDTIREAYGFPKPMLGASDDVNRANAEAAEVVFARWLLVPRLERLKLALNNDLLPLFGEGTANELEFDYENPVPEDAAAENNELTAKSNALKIYVELGVEFSSACEALGLPEMDYEKPEPPPPPVLPGPPPGQEEPGVEEDPAEEEEEEDVPAAKARHVAPLRALHTPVGFPVVYAAKEDVDDVDLSAMQTAWERALDDVIRQWPDITNAQRDELIRQVTKAIDEDDLDALATLRIDSSEGARLIQDAMEAIALDAAYQVQREAQQQGVYTVQPMLPDSAELASTAQFTATLLAAELALSAAREAMRVKAPGMTGTEVARSVGTHLRSLSDAYPRREIGGALTGAQNAARIETMKVGPVAALYANEKNDKNTCKPCGAVHGRWLGNSDNESDMTQVNRMYPTSGYIDCEGGPRCRGTVTAVWRPKTVGG